MAIVVAAIDFGTTFSGWAFSFLHEYKTDPTRIATKYWHAGSGTLVSEKAPSCVLVKPDGKTLHAFGYDAENEYTRLAENGRHTEYYYFKRFKMILNRKLEEGLSRGITLEDDKGKELPALLVFALTIRHLKDDLLNVCQTRLTGEGIHETDFMWVLTVPAIWNDAAKQFMREAAIKAGIQSNHLQIALEPEAASIFCRHIPVEKQAKGSSGCEIAKFRPGTKYMVLDAGGGTVDITIHEVKADGGLKEIHKATGGGWGGTLVDEEFRQMLIRLVGNPVHVKFKKNHTEDWLDMLRDFEIKKRQVKPDGNDRITFRIPLALLDLFRQETGEEIKDCLEQTRYARKVSFTGDKMRCEASVMQDLFKDPITRIVDHVKGLLTHTCVQGLSAILMVGGFSDSQMLQAAIKSAFPSMRIIVPPEAGLCVLKGAVIYGHKPSSITERVIKYTYGFNTTRPFKTGEHPKSKKQLYDGVWRCNDIFSKHVELDQTIQLETATEEVEYNPLYEDQKEIGFTFYASKTKDPAFITDPGCTKIGTMTVQIPDLKGGKKRYAYVRLIFGDTEIRVEAREGNTGKVTDASFNFLG